jgi:hypothetical protein
MTIHAIVLSISIFPFINPAIVLSIFILSFTDPAIVLSIFILSFIDPAIVLFMFMNKAGVSMWAGTRYFYLSEIAGSMNDNININSTIAESMNDNINMDNPCFIVQISAKIYSTNL